MSTAVSPTLKPAAPAQLVQDRKFIDNSSSASAPRPGTGSIAQVIDQPHEKIRSVQSHSRPPAAVDLAEPSNLRTQVLSTTSGDSGNDSETEISQAEINLETEIGHLWSMKLKSSSSVRRNRERVAVLKAQLAEQLYRYKQLLAKTGRGGKWTSFLLSLDINRASADRWVAAHERLLSPAQPVNRLMEALSEPSHEEIAALVKKVKPKLASVLTTPSSATQFLSQLSAALSLAAPSW